MMKYDENTLFFSMPGRDFPSVSVTGTACDLMCEHCRAVHLKGMLDVPAGMRAATTGILFSGGCDANGAVLVITAVDKIRELNAKGLKANIHPGFSSPKEIAELGALDIVFSVDIHQDPGVISSVLHLNKKPEDYSELLDKLIATGRKVIPHITVGFGTDDLYLSAKLAKSKGLDKVVVLTMVPTEGTAVEDVSISEEAILDAVDMIMEMGVEVALGCMRDRRLRTLEIECIKRGVRRIANPSVSTVAWAKENGYKTIEEKMCCSMEF